MRTIATLSFILIMSGCVTKQLIMQTPVVSMTKNNAPAGAKLSEGQEVKARWCTGDKPIVDNDDGTTSYGMIDQAIHKAHQETKADFFMNNRFYAESNGCVSMVSNVAKVSAGGGRGGDDEAGDGGEAEAKPAKSKAKPKGKKKKAS